MNMIDGLLRYLGYKTKPVKKPLTKKSKYGISKMAVGQSHLFRVPLEERSKIKKAVNEASRKHGFKYEQHHTSTGVNVRRVS